MWACGCIGVLDGVCVCLCVCGGVGMCEGLCTYVRVDACVHPISLLYKINDSDQ